MANYRGGDNSHILDCIKTFKVLYSEVFATEIFDKVWNMLVHTKTNNVSFSTMQSLT